MSRLLTALHSGRVLLMDGAMGTELQRAGIKEGECYELWNLTHPNRVRAIHQAYVDAGAEVLLTNTFQANPAALAKHGLEAKLEDMNQAAIDLARSVCGVKHFVLASIGPMALPEREALARTVYSLRMADALLLETWSESFAVFAAEQACQPAVNPHQIPVLLSFTYRRSPAPGMLPPIQMGGLDPVQVAKLAQTVGIAALGVNCGRDLGMDEISEIIRRYRSVTDLPLFARPNAGTPTRIADRWVYPQTPELMAARLPELLAAGVRMVGGCCGTTPVHMAAFRPIIDTWNARQEQRSKQP
jgi:5-methyltetrahydrofolate--homocysteine methyltransferase